MSLFDWVELGVADKGDELEWFKGTCSVTIGDMLLGKFGAQHEHLFGSKTLMVCDPEDMLLGKLDKFMPLVTGLLAGIGGNSTFNYGSAFTATYVGPKIEVRRAPSHSKVSDNLLVHKTVTVGGVTQESDEIDKATSIAAAVLSVLIVATAAALELALHFAYPKFGSTNPSDHETIEGYGKTPELLKVCCYTITSRLMGLLKVLEEKGSLADFAEQFLLEAKFVALTTTFVAGMLFPPLLLITIALCKSDEDVVEAITHAKDALVAAAD
jgi:hypothetical protein